MSSMNVYRNSALLATGIRVKRGATRLRAYHLYNTGAAGVYVKLYDKRIAPTVGTDTPLLSLPVGAGQGANLYLGDEGLEFTDGLGVAATTGVDDADTNAPGSTDVSVHLFYN